MIQQRPWRSSCACKLIDVNLHGEGGSFATLPVLRLI